MTDLEEFLTSNDITSLLSNEKNYPSKMTIARPKNHKIFHVGNVIDYEKCVSIVGTRSCSEFGAQFAFDLAKELVNHDYKIISGLAQGIDASAHHGCIENNGIGIAIMAWFHKIYPPQNKQLFDEILENGCGFTENPLEPEKNSRFEFLKRDELIAVMSDVVIVVESKSKGGAKYTADYAKKKKIPVIKCKTETDDFELIEGHKIFLANGSIEATSPEHVIKLISELKGKKELKDNKKQKKLFED
jgi:DNA processing protein